MAVAPVLQYRTIGPTPLVVRLVVDAAAIAGPGGAIGVMAEVSFTVRPRHTSGNLASPSCSGWRHGATAYFDGSVGFGNDSAPGGSVMVFGLDTQPLFFGFGAPQAGAPAALPCVLLPQPDVVVPFDPALPFSLTFPPAAQPLALYSQGVMLLASGLALTNALQVVAD
jgi:hypothetical protein